MKNLPNKEHLEWNSWLVDGVFVDIKGHYWVGNSKAVCHFWIGIDNAISSRVDLQQLVSDIVGENNALEIEFNRVEQYTHHFTISGIGLQHIGLFFTWSWSVTEDCKQELDSQKRFRESETRAFTAIGKLIDQLKSNGVPLSEQPPYSSKNTWLNHFRPAIEHLMSLGPGFWLPALTLSIPCIDAAYQDSEGKRRDSYTKDMLRWVFDPDNVYESHENLNKAIRLLAAGLANGLKHDTLIREPITLYNPYVTINHNEPPEFSVYLGNDETRTVLSVRMDITGAESVLVVPSLWWETVRIRIDRHYNLL